jgi:hypothetical protein
MRTRILANGPTPKKTHKKLDGNIGRHLKKKNGNAKSVPTYVFTYTLKEITALSYDDG